jgi:predicted amidohydrolase
LGDDVYNSALFIAAGSETSPTVYRKSHLYGDYEKSLFHLTQPETVLVDHAGIKIGLLICYDVEFPENVRRLAQAGAQVVLVPTALPESSHAAFIAKNVIAVRAFENQVFVAYGNHAGGDAAFVYAGMSHIAAPDGKSLAFAPDNKPALLFAELDPSRYAASKLENSYLTDLKSDA